MSAPASVGGWWREFRTLDVEVAVRAAIAAAVPLTVLVATGRTEWAAYAAFGAMTAIFGRSEPYGTRLRTVTTAALVQVAATGLGILLAVVHAPHAVEAIVLAVLITAVIVAYNLLGVTPSGPLFAVFGLLVCAAQPIDDGTGWQRWGVAWAAAAFAWLLAMSGWVLRRAAPGRAKAVFRDLPRRTPVRVHAWSDARLWLNVVQNVAAALLAGAAALALGIGHPYWAVVSAVAVIPPARAAHTAQRAVHRVAGTLVGVVVTALVLWPDPPAWVLIVVIAVCQFGAELLVGRHYGAALVFVTPLALVVVHLASPVPVFGLLADRVLETVLGAAVGLLAVLAAKRLAEADRLPPPSGVLPSVGPKPR
ncbi:Fusaric acid resistance protein-like [Agromyces sp. CF514]|uniref:FUSC family protein n=1 Tax=Agromyces sp. CF514 TaxID=1881031 RepID=UPI0008E2C4E2|nr:FUSC family protein [Agromyces sp. CF514]SFR72459.1 Fusaric acid resistance protein-like [Agromyces sp. CF514]